MSSALIQSGLPSTFGGMIDETRYIPPHFEEEVNATKSVTVDGSKATKAIIKMSCGTGGATGNVWFQKAAQDGKFTIENNYARNTTTGVETTTPQVSLKYDGTNTGMCVNGTTLGFGLPNTTTVTTAATLTGAQIRQRLIVVDPTGSITLTLPTIAQVFPATLFSNVVAGMFIDCTILNIDSSTDVVTVAVSADITSDLASISKLTVTAFGGVATVNNQIGAGRFRIVVTAASAGVPTAGKIYAI
jgi:hypothetical protein